MNRFLTKCLFIWVLLHKYPNLFDGYKKHKVIPHSWSYAACAVLKISQDIYDFVCLGLFFEFHGIFWSNLYKYPWKNQLICLCAAFYFTRHHTFPVELRISDIQCW